jgi:hypothetical protein
LGAAESLVKACRKGQTIMSSSAAPKVAAAFVVQSGVVAWEDPASITDWRFKTVTVVATRSSFVAKLLRDLVASPPLALQRIFRMLIVRRPPAATASQMRRFTAQLAADPPGFASTNTTVVGDVCCSISELQEINAVDVSFLTGYRHCALIGTRSSLSPTTDLCAMIGHEISEFGGSGLAKLLESGGAAAVIRVLETPPYSVVQLLGVPEFCDAVARFLEDHEVCRIHDVRRIFEEVRRLSS